MRKAPIEIYSRPHNMASIVPIFHKTYKISIRFYKKVLYQFQLNFMKNGQNSIYVSVHSRGLHCTNFKDKHF